MNYTLQLHGERMLYPTPPGLYELMSDITREVLRDQPAQVYEYIAHYLDTLVRVRQYARTGEEVVGDVLQENSELLAFVRSLGVSWSEANLAASKVQRAFRTFKCKRELRLKIKLNEELSRMRRSTSSPSCTQSFLEYLESLGVDLERAEKATSIIQQAYKAYRTKIDKEKTKKPKTKHASTHTIDDIKFKSHVIAKKSFKRDSKLLVYQQTPRQSEESTWSTLMRNLDEEEAELRGNESSWTGARKSKDVPQGKVKPFTLVYEQDKSLSNYKYFPKQLQSDYSTVPTSRMSLPSYYNEYGEKIPMISESGLLLNEEDEDVVTLFSSDSVDDDVKRRSRGSSFAGYPTVGNLKFGPKNEEMAKELFEIIGTGSPPMSELASSDKKSLSEQHSIIRTAVSKGSTSDVPAVQKKSTIIRIPLYKKSLRTGGVGRPTLRLQGSETEKQEEKEEQGGKKRSSGGSGKQ